MTGARVLAAGGILASLCMAGGYVQAAGWIMLFANSYTLLWGRT